MNSIKDVCVYVNYEYDDTAMIHAGARIAAEYDAHLTGIYASQPPTPYYGVGLDGTVPQILIDQYVEEMTEHTEKNHDIFESIVREYDVKSTWHSDDGYPESVVSKWFRYADLNFMAQVGKDASSASRSQMNALLLSSGRPIVIVPNHLDIENMHNRILIGWDGGKEAARAVHDAIPLLQNADSVEVFMIESDKKENMLSSSVPLTHHLARHGVSVESTSQPRGKKSTGQTIIDRAARINADLIVVGAWGHARASEYLFGGVSRTLLDNADIPVLMSH